MIITNSLGSNYSDTDRRLALMLLFTPWRIDNSVIPDLIGNLSRYLYRSRAAPRRLESSGMTGVALFYKGRQAITAALRDLGIGRSDEVIVQAFTCRAVVWPILAVGATPRYADISPRSLNPSLENIRLVYTRRTKAILLQHTLGYVNPEHEQILAWCAKNNIAVIEDLAHAFGAPGLGKVQPFQERLDLNRTPTKLRPNIRYILSFSQDKILDSVTGGALLTPSPTNLNELIHQSGVSSAKLLLYPLLTYLIRSTYIFGAGKVIHEISKYLGLLSKPIDGKSVSSAEFPAVLAPLALNQLRQLPQFLDHRYHIALIYDKYLPPALKLVTKNEIKSGSNLRYPIWVEDRDKLANQLKKFGFYLFDHWYDAPVAPVGIYPSDVKYKLGSCPNAEILAQHVFNLPTHLHITSSQAIYLANMISRKARPFLI